jgi:hypothetical protein
MSKHVQERRDEELGAWLAELGEPQHRDDFFPALERRLAAERTGRPGAAPRRRAGRRFAVRVAVVAAIVAVVVLFVGLPRDDRLPESVQPSVASAASVKAAVRAALANAETLSGVLVSDGPDRDDENRWRFLVTAKGDFRLTGLTLVENIAYDATTGVQRSLNPSASLGVDTLFAAERRGVAPGPPDGGPATWILPRDYGAVVRALLAADDPRVRETTYEHRPAWLLDIDVAPNAIVPDFSGDRLEITVDRATGIPLRVIETKHGAFLRELRIENLAVDAEPGPHAFTLDFPAGADVLQSDDGFRRVALDDVAAAVGYAPLVPSIVPEGYELSEVAMARTAGPTGTEGGNPPSRMVVSLSYRRGLDQFLVTTRLTGPAGASRWSDPLATGEGFKDEPESVHIGGGALDGASARLLIAPRSIPHLFAVTDELVVTVGGDLTRAELLAVASSLAPHR